MSPFLVMTLFLLSFLQALNYYQNAMNIIPQNPVGFSLIVNNSSFEQSGSYVAGYSMYQINAVLFLLAFFILVNITVVLGLLLNNKMKGLITNEKIIG